MLYISAVDNARKLKFSSYVHLPSTNKMFQYRYAGVILFNVHVEEVIIFMYRRYISAFVILSSYVLLAGMNTIYKYGHAWLS